MRTRDLEDKVVPTIIEAIQSGEVTPEILLVFQTQLLTGILMALNDLLAALALAQQPKQFINAYSLPIRD